MSNDAHGLPMPDPRKPEMMCCCCGDRIDRKLQEIQDGLVRKELCCICEKMCHRFDCVEERLKHIHHMLHCICDHLKIPVGITLTHGDPIPNVSPEAKTA